MSGRRARRAAVSSVGLAFLAAACGGGGQPTEEPDAVADVDVIVARQDTLVERMVAFGEAEPAPSATRSLSLPFESTVIAVHATAGQEAAAGDPLIDVAPSPSARLQIEAARTAFETEERALRDAERRLELGLATRAEVDRERQDFENARREHESLRGWLPRHRITAPAAGVVASISVSRGSLVPAGTPLGEFVLAARIAVRIGVEPEDAALVTPGLGVELEPVGPASAARRTAGHVLSVAKRIDPTTRLVDVIVEPADSSRILLGEFVRATIRIRSASGLVVPRAAVLPTESGHSLFTVSGDTARAHEVTIGVETDSLMSVTAPDLAALDTVVVLGNYELRDGMPVRIVDPASRDTSAAPAPAIR